MLLFGQKLLNTQCGVGRCTYKSPILKWANALKESSKSSLNLNAASHNNASGYTDTDGFLEHLPSGESLYYKGLAHQKIMLVLGGDPLYLHLYLTPYTKISFRLKIACER